MKIPDTLIKSLQHIPGFNEGLFLKAHEQAPVTSVRNHPLKHSHRFDDQPQIPWCPSGNYLHERPVFTLDPAFHAGAYYVQEASSMFLDEIMRQIMPDGKQLRVLDLCAAPGGKSTLLASVLNPGSLLISNEVIRARASILEENMTRWGYINTWVTSNDPRDFGRIEGYFDIIITDAPCSGSGLFRKDIHALNEWSESNVQLCSARQQRILADVWPALKQDGILVYATCSFSPEEDEQIIDWLGTTYHVEGIPIQLQEEWGIIQTESPVCHFPAYRFFPGNVTGEGFFVAILRKKDGTDNFYYPRIHSASNRKAAEAASHLLQQGEYSFIENDRKIFTAIHSFHEPDFHLLKEYVYLRKAGILSGFAAQKEWIPEHDIALSINASDNIPAIELDTEEALRFLKKDSIDIPATTPKGWYIVRYRGLGLGWIKVLGNRINNYLPRQWRIRMDTDK